MKRRFLTFIRKSIKNQYPNYTEDKLDEIMYGVEGIYLTFTKMIIIFSLALLLGIFKELIILLLFFNFIRLFAFGMHADKSIICLIFSSTIFLGCAFLSKYLVINKSILFILYFISIIIISIYAPADTVKRPLIKEKKRKRYKILSIIVSIIFFTLSFFIKDNLIVNCLIFSLLIECLLILPITYRIFNLPYRNYKNYGLNT